MRLVQQREAAYQARQLSEQLRRLSLSTRFRSFASKVQLTLPNTDAVPAANFHLSLALEPINGTAAVSTICETASLMPTTGSTTTTVCRSRHCDKTILVRRSAGPPRF